MCQQALYLISIKLVILHPLRYLSEAKRHRTPALGATTCTQCRYPKPKGTGHLHWVLQLAPSAGIRSQEAPDTCTGFYNLHPVQVSEAKWHRIPVLGGMTCTHCRCPKRNGSTMAPDTCTGWHDLHPVKVSGPQGHTE